MPMQDWQQARECYEAVEIPEVLDSAVDTAIQIAAFEPRAARSGRAARLAALTAACLCIAFVVAVNASPVLALGLYDLPVIGNVAKVFTFREYEEVEEANLVLVRMPALADTGNTALEDRINYEIRIKMTEALEEAKTRAREYRQAFLETGGKASDFIPIEIQLDYEIKCNNEQIVSFVITKSEAGANYYQEQFFYNIDLETGRELTLRDLYGQDYVEQISESVRHQIEQREASDPDQMFYDNEEAFTAIQPDQAFYINEDEQAVVVFEKYEIAPGYMGVQEFQLVKTSP